jgi:NAD(P)-dependent dehydrogenase (short-subunit alcohol dehydrogenase family)
METNTETDLKGKVAVVTGAARGMGRAIGEGFLKRGARVVATDRSWEGVEPIANALSDGGKNVLAADMDVTREDQMDTVYAATLDRFGTVDILVGNAAMRSRDLFPPSGRAVTLDTRDSDWERMFAVNVFGALKVIRRFIRPMIEKKRGSIVNVVSSGILHHSHGGGYVALRPTSVEMPYMATKAALATLSFYLGAEVKEHNIAVNVVIPGHTRTTGFDEQNRARLARGARPGPLPVVPEHAVPIVMHLAGQDASGITGTMFDIMKWNVEHGLGGHARWADKDFSYEALMPRR